jgi:hypothetical protein
VQFAHSSVDFSKSSSTRCHDLPCNVHAKFSTPLSLVAQHSAAQSLTWTRGPMMAVGSFNHF